MKWQVISKYTRVSTPGIVLLNACSQAGLLGSWLVFPRQNGLRVLDYLSLEFHRQLSRWHLKLNF